MAVKIFCCYAHEDEVLLLQLKSHLKPLQRQGLIDVWHDRDITAGTEWQDEIDKHLNIAQIILLLISSDFMNSDYCYGTEMKRALERHARGEARVIPVILRHTYWQGMLGKLQALPKDGLPVTDHDWHNIDKTLFNVAEGIRAIVEGFIEKPSIKPTSPSLIPPPNEPANRMVGTSKNTLDDPSDRVVVVAARNALLEYVKHSVYICQPNRAIQSCVRMAFYTINKIDRRVPKILGQIEAITREEIETRKDLKDVERERLRTTFKNLTQMRSDELSQKFKIVFLSSPESPETLILPHDIVNNLTSSDGKRTAFTQGQRYVSLSRLEKGPETTSELI